MRQGGDAQNPNARRNADAPAAPRPRKATKASAKADFDRSLETFYAARGRDDRLDDRYAREIAPTAPTVVKDLVATPAVRARAAAAAATGTNFSKFRKNAVNVAEPKDIVARATMTRLMRDETETELQLRRECEEAERLRAEADVMMDDNVAVPKKKRGRR